jgi:GT2 family glycosyltransferase/peptidoglycan/xylan/chitin deacetylase (PgdA/CDA1 family)
VRAVRQRPPVLRISVVIPTFQRRELLARTLTTVFRQDLPVDQYEVVVVVDGSTDGTLEMLHRLRPPCRLTVREQENRGPAAARNAGLAAAKGEFVLFVDDDILCDRSLLRQHLAGHDEDGAVLVFGPVYVSDESPPALTTAWTLKSTERYIRRLEREGEPRWPEDAMVDANSSVPRSVLDRQGGFDERFLLRREVADLGLRLWRAGVHFRYRPAAVVHHVFAKSERDVVGNDAWFWGTGEIRLCRKHPEYRPYSPLARLPDGPAWKRSARRISVRSPISPEGVLRPPYLLAERFHDATPVQRVGVRLLEARQAITVYRGAASEAGSWDALASELGATVPVLLYHHVGPPRAGIYRELTISPEKFARQIRWLARRGYVGIAPSDWLEWHRRGARLPRKPVLVSFDDAYADIAEYALPVLRTFGFRALVFVVTGRIGGTNDWDEAPDFGAQRLLTDDEIRRWADHGTEFGAHSRSHANLTTLPEEELENEIAGSRDDLADLLGTRVTSFAYPYGRYDDVVRRHVASAFDVAFTADKGLNTLRTDLHLLRRTMVQPSDSLVDLESRLRIGWSPYERLRDRVRLRSRIRSAVHRPSVDG